MEDKVTCTNEKKTLIVILFTLITMLAEIVYGYVTHSMALLADGYHMGTHALALGLAYAGYIFARKFQNSSFFPNGTDKINVLAAYTSSLILGFTGIWIIIEASQRLLSPLIIRFSEAITVAVIGLIVNTICILIMEHSHHHEKEEHEDYNFKAAYYHILADILTSILAIIALLAGKYFNLTVLDPIIGIVGGLLIIKWAASLLKKTVYILIDKK